eukprot:TRINITY_DN808_c0_g1_i2.p1 TRINITY_DN808_c0_g1~~TRINITY_DN808_c0_g1_i2.p1  ORF type:complete len:504 (-),score=181.01 TRINITY_DN808_c0_g1_i2:333-1814(-)
MSQQTAKGKDVQALLQRSVDTAQGIVHFVNGRNKKMTDEARTFQDDPAKEEAFRKLMSELQEYRSMLETQIAIITQEKQSFMDMQTKAEEQLKQKLEELDAARPPPGVRDKREWNGRRESAIMAATDLRVEQLEIKHRLQLDQLAAEVTAKLKTEFAVEREDLERTHEETYERLTVEIGELNQKLNQTLQEKDSAIEAANQDLERRVSVIESELRVRYEAELQAKDELVAELRNERIAAAEAVTQHESRLQLAQQELEDAKRELEDAKREAERAVKLTEIMVRDEYEPRLSAANERYQQEFHQRRMIYNQLQELKGNIRVYCRVRPMSNTEAAIAAEPCITFPADHELTMNKKKYSFNHIFTPDSTQENVFDEVRPLVVSVLDGYNVCIFAYGQTGSGKTHTMEGREGDRGVNPRALTTLFEKAQERSATHTYTIQVSMLEIYNEQIRDLLNADNDAKLEIRQGERGPHVPELSIVGVKPMEDVWNCMKTGAR